MKKHKVGRPTKYKRAICVEMIKFFDIPHIIEVPIIKSRKDGTTYSISISKPNSLPTFERFACKLNVVVDTLHEWKKVHKEFSESYKKCQQLQKDMLVDLALLGYYNAAFTIFTAKNITDMKDKTETDVHNYDHEEAKLALSKLTAEELAQLNNLTAKMAN